MNIRMLTVIAALLVTSPAAPANSRKSPEVLSPADNQQIGEKEDDILCVEEPTCSKVRVEGWVPKHRTAFLAVEPLNVSPRMWIQPPIHRVKKDGTFSGLVYLGEEENGARQYFRIYVFACKNPDRFTERQQIVRLPSDCEVSDPVEVYRIR